VKQHFQLARFVIFLFLSLVAAACGTIERPRTIAMRTDTTVSRPSSLVNINRASLEELQMLPGIGKMIAERIVAHRERYGAFRRTEHLLMVRGISDQKFRELQPLITVE
jgi:competence ComEA-like helix-hairpin-helix protein